MKSDWEQHLEKLDRRQKMVKSIILRGILWVFIVSAVFRIIALIPELFPEDTTQEINHIGNIIYVDSEAPIVVNTLNQSLDLCEPGDIIFITPDHSETLSSIDIDVSNISIVGLGINKKIFTFTMDEK